MESLLTYFYPEAETFLSYFDKDAVIILDEPNRIVECAGASEKEFAESMSHRLENGYILPGQMEILLSAKQVQQQFNRRRAVSLSAMEPIGGEWKFNGSFRLNVQSVSPYNNSFEMLVKDLKRGKKNGCSTVVLSASRTRAMRLSEDLRDEKLNSFYSEDMTRQVQPGEILVCQGHAHRGYEYPFLKFLPLV